MEILNIQKEGKKENFYITIYLKSHYTQIFIFIFFYPKILIVYLFRVVHHKFIKEKTCGNRV